MSCRGQRVRFWEIFIPVSLIWYIMRVDPPVGSKKSAFWTRDVRKTVGIPAYKGGFHPPPAVNISGLQFGEDPRVMLPSDNRLMDALIDQTKEERQLRHMTRLADIDVSDVSDNERKDHHNQQENHDNQENHHNHDNHDNHNHNRDQNTSPHLSTALPPETGGGRRKYESDGRGKHDTDTSPQDTIWPPTTTDSDSCRWEGDPVVESMSPQQREQWEQKRIKELLGDGFDEGVKVAETQTSTPEDHAEHARSEGNGCIRLALRALVKMAEATEFRNKTLLRRTSKIYFRRAVKHYTDALRVKDYFDLEAIAAFRANRAQAHLYLQNHKSAYTDALAAIEHLPGDRKNMTKSCSGIVTKAYWRAARACYEMGFLDKAHELVEEGIGDEPSRTYTEIYELTLLKGRIKRRRLKERRKREEKERVRLAVEQSRISTITHVFKRGYRFCAPTYMTAPLVTNHRPKLRGDNVIWPVIFVFPEVLQSDLVLEWDERLTIGQQLDVMDWSDTNRGPIWDAQHKKYTRRDLELYYEANMGRILDDRVVEEQIVFGWNRTSEVAVPIRGRYQYPQYTPLDTYRNHTIQPPNTITQYNHTTLGCICITHTRTKV
ncbi:hypothetical protein AAMO2058_000943200 [Amorphochlora amoebiformis]